MAEMAALEHLNATRASRGEPPVPKLTISELRAALKGATVRGQEWKAGNKKKTELLQDYLALMGEQAGVQQTGLFTTTSISHDTGTTSTSVADTQASTPSSARRSPFAAFKKLTSRSSRKSNTSSISSAPPKPTLPSGIEYDDDGAIEINVPTLTGGAAGANNSGDFNLAMKQMRLGSSSGQTTSGASGGSNGSKTSRDPSRPAWIPG